MSKKSRKRQEKFLVRAQAARLESLNSNGYPLGPTTAINNSWERKEAHIGCIEPSLQVAIQSTESHGLYLKQDRSGVWPHNPAVYVKLFAKMIAASHDFYRLPRHPVQHHSIGAIGALAVFWQAVSHQARKN